jgi:beta-lactamase regulating signal transducer with metallopeptidase domain
MRAALLDHLWQSTLFAICAWSLTLVLRKNGAHLRHAVWLVASIKFLIPFSLMTMLGQQMKPYVGIENAHALALGAGDLSTLLGAPARAILAEPIGALWPWIATAVWLIGFLTLSFRWLIRWRGVREVLRTAVPTATVAPVPVRTSAGLREPGVVGIVRPVLLLPEGITTQLTPLQLEAVLRHEVCHLRRHDNLTSAIHMLVETIFWFHPLVWWIGARMLEERERACDESVVRSGSDPRIYAEGILRVCRSYLASDLACVAGVSGADLKLRLEAIMTKEVKELGSGKRFALGVLAVAAISVPVMVGLTLPPQVEAAAPQQAMKPVGKIELLAGKRVKLQYQDVDVRGLIRAMGEAASVNILVSDRVSGTVTVKLAEMPWDQALDIILNSQGLVKREKDGILFIEPASA